MSRIGKKPVQLPDKVRITTDDNMIKVNGLKGYIERNLHPAVEIQIRENMLEVKTAFDKKNQGALQGLFRSLIANMVTGVTEGFQKQILLSGIGYRAETKENNLILNVGYSKPVNFSLPKGIKADVDGGTKITLTGIDKEVLGQTAANIRRIRPPEPYKGKGIMYANERIIRKAGKTAAKS